MGVWSLPLEACDRSVINVSLDSYSHMLFVPNSCQGTSSRLRVAHCICRPKFMPKYRLDSFRALLQARFKNKRAPLRTAVVNSWGSAACLRCWPMGDNGVLRVGMLFVVKRRCSWPRTSPALWVAAWEPKVLRKGEVRPRAANDDCSSRGERRPPRSPMPVEKTMFN